MRKKTYKLNALRFWVVLFPYVGWTQFSFFVKYSSMSLSLTLDKNEKV